MPNSAENSGSQQIPARIITRDWLKQNVKVGWIAETLHLPMIAAVTPILERFLVDVEADLREEITKLRGEAREMREEIKVLRVGLEKAAATFADLERALRVLNRPVLADACKVAKDGTVAILAESMTEPHRSILLGKFA